MFDTIDGLGKFLGEDQVCVYLCGRPLVLCFDGKNSRVYNIYKVMSFEERHGSWVQCYYFVVDSNRLMLMR